jgi:hypothetical protein
VLYAGAFFCGGAGTVIFLAARRRLCEIFEINQQPDSGDITNGFAAKPRRDNDEQSRSKTK